MAGVCGGFWGGKICTGWQLMQCLLLLLLLLACVMIGGRGHIRAGWQRQDGMLPGSRQATLLRVIPPPPPHTLTPCSLPPPSTQILLGYTLLRKPLGPPQLLGCALVVAGVVLAAWPSASGASPLQVSRGWGGWQQQQHYPTPAAVVPVLLRAAMGGRQAALCCECSTLPWASRAHTAHHGTAVDGCSALPDHAPFPPHAASRA